MSASAFETLPVEEYLNKPEPADEEDSMIPSFDPANSKEDLTEEKEMFNVFRVTTFKRFDNYIRNYFQFMKISLMLFCYISVRMINNQHCVKSVCIWIFLVRIFPHLD